MGGRVEPFGAVSLSLPRETRLPRGPPAQTYPPLSTTEFQQRIVYFAQCCVGGCDTSGESDTARITTDIRMP